jgi:mRNA-degrading endonuclease RelE of RelBE toxin-antitoxin system
MYEVVWLQSAVDDLADLFDQNRRQARRVVVTVRTFGRDGRGDFKKLQGPADEWRLRIGDWRAFVQLEQTRAYITRIDNRRDAY